MATAKLTLTMKVLIADDTDSVRFALRLVLEHLGHEVIGYATNGQDAIDKCASMHPELIVMDVRMPLIDGLTCTTMLSKSSPDSKVVIVTGSRTTESEAREAGARGFVEKPFDVRELDRAICGALAAA
ncbi:MAG TPA: response regulator transcription factor [Verrucomicrobiae bacterium]|nr:response regulator transcription factor [Verrucomicrobiae bacterium]